MLTPRQRQILMLVAEGKRDKQIAPLVGLDHTTVRHHIQNALERLGAHTRAHAVAMLLKDGENAGEIGDHSPGSETSKVR